MKIIITGATGFIGKAVTERLLAKQHQVVALTRTVASKMIQHPNLIYAQWDGSAPGEWMDHVNGADAIINFAGEGIAGKRWSAQQKKIILESRINCIRILQSAISQAHQRPLTFISASAVGFYGDREEGVITEVEQQGSDFLAGVCGRWEQAASVLSSLNVRVVICRFGVVLDAKGGALPKLITPFNVGFGGWLGTGKQWFPWIHRDDVVDGVLHVLRNPSIEGPVNFTAPHSVRMKEFCQVIGKTLHRPCWAPVPSFALRIALGEMAEMLLTGQQVTPEKLLNSGYSFKYPELSEALTQILIR